MILVVGVLLLGWFLYPTLRLHYQEQRKLQQLQTQLAQIQDRNRQLKAQVQDLKTPAGIEAAARDLGLAKKGEQLWVTMRGGKVTSDAATSAVQAAVAPPGPLTRLLDAVFGVAP